jgi:hypothetical protein
MKKENEAPDELDNACEQGQVVFQHSFGKSAWEEIDLVRKWQGKYFSESEMQNDGPFENLKAAIESLPTGNAIVDATTEIECGEMSDEELAAYLEVDGADEGNTVTLNQVPYVVRNGKLSKK